MSTSLLYHGFSIRGYQYVRSLFVHGRIVFKIKQDRFSLRCPECRSTQLILKGHVSRPLHTGKQFSGNSFFTPKIHKKSIYFSSTC